MIAVELSGGLGNQLFQYAFIYNRHKKLGTRFILLKRGTPIQLYKYFYLEKNLFYSIDRLLFNHGGLSLVFSHYLRGAFYKVVCKLALKQHLTADNLDDPCEILEKAKNGIFYHGYFQSEIYFNEHKYDLHRIFKIRSKYKRMYSQKLNWLNSVKTIVAIHIRATDYKFALAHLDLGNTDLTLPLSYYHKVIERIHTNNNFYIFISDDITTIKKEFDYLENKHFSEESEIVDFQIMMNADCCVIANSTFSWWASYLNNKINKQVYCPKNFLGFLTGIDYPTAIYPETWIQIPVI